MTPRFVHLHLHSEYSLVDGLIRLPELISHCVEHNAPAIALTDQSNVFGVSKFYRRAMSDGVKPIIGTELWLHDEAKSCPEYRVVFLCQNNAGYRNLSVLITKAYRKGQKGGVPRVQPEWLLRKA